jgi:ABC-2 type transport system permease protein
MRFALHAEWTKLRTVAANGWLLLAAIALTVALGAATAAAVN